MDWIKNERVKNASDSIKKIYYTGWNVLRNWLSTKKYIVNHLNSNWQDPNTLPSGYNITSLLIFLRDTCAQFESVTAAKAS